MEWERMLDPKETTELESLNIFMFNFVKTYDNLDPSKPIKYMPNKPHLRDLNRVFVRERLAAIPKSRQMQCTWWATAAYCWDTYRHPARFTIFKSTDKQHSGLAHKLMLLWRANFIHEQLPDCIRSSMKKVKGWRRDNILEYPENDGHIQAMSMEGDASVSFTATGCFDDELSIQQYGEAGFTVILPLLGTVGRYIALFTYRGLNFAYRLAHDKMEMGELWTPTTT